MATSSAGERGNKRDEKAAQGGVGCVGVGESAGDSWNDLRANRACFKFIGSNNNRAAGGYQTRFESALFSSQWPSSSLSSVTSGVEAAMLERSNSVCSASLLPSLGKHIDSVPSERAPTSRATRSPLRVSAQRSGSKIGPGGIACGPHEVDACARSPLLTSPARQRKLSRTNWNSIERATARAIVSAAALLLLLAQLCQIPSHALGQAAPAPSKLEPENLRLQLDATSGLPNGPRDLREAKPLAADKLPVNVTNMFQILFKKRPYSKYWTVEQKWDDLFKRAMAVGTTMRQAMLKNFMRDIENFADITISPPCERDLKYVQSYARQSTNFRWLAHMVDSTGKSEPGMLTGMLAHLGHPIQCIRVRAPGRPSNHTFDERFFEQQTELLGERFRGKYCVASLRPVLPRKPANVAVSRFSDIMNASMLSNISYTGEPEAKIKARMRQLLVPASDIASVDRDHLRLDQVPFESELYEYLIAQRNFMFTLPRFMGVCYPSSCSKEDVRSSLQRTLNDNHQVVDVEFECEQEEMSAWDWFSTPRLIAYVVAALVCGLVLAASLVRYILLSKLQIKRSRLHPDSALAGLLDALDMFSIDKCAGILFVKTKPASPLVDWTKVENNRSTSIDALRGLAILLLVYSQLTVLGCLPVPFMWSKWSDTMFPFYRSLVTQPFINMSIWSELFYLISAFIIALKVLENHRPRPALAIDIVGNLKVANSRPNSAAPSASQFNAMDATYRAPNLFSFVAKRYVRLVLPMVAFILFNYVWPRLSNGFVMQDQANKIMRPCDSYGWTNFFLFHNHQPLNETCLWPSHVSATFFQLHLLSYPILVLCLVALSSQFRVHYGDYDDGKQRRSRLVARLLICLVYAVIGLLALLGALYSALQASQKSLVVPFLIDYIDYDNYRRVIEWTVLPTYNHLTGYALGIAVAFVVAHRRAKRELHRMQRSQWGLDNGAGHYAHREGSVESIRSSSTQELHQQSYGMNVGTAQQIHQKQFNISTDSSTSSERHYESDDKQSSSYDGSSFGSNLAKSSLCLTLCLVSLLASWFWNGLGQPMSDEQTFWFVLLTKLAFCCPAAYLFHEHFATRRNSTNPWMITRFLVPIGRMSLTVFYVSWLVIWFDLLSSLYQWHPSHYFVCEKYNEIIFMTLILAMLIYAAFEGIVKRIQYASRTLRFKRDLEMSTTLTADGIQPSGARNRCQLAPFESFFEPSDKPTPLELWDELKQSGSLNDLSSSKAERQSASAVDGNKMNSAETADGQQQPAVFANKSNLQRAGRPAYLSSTGDVSIISGNFGNLSPSDRYKLNAELRANYSFASIGLYESAGATGDLSHQQAANDPRDKRR